MSALVPHPELLTPVLRILHPAIHSHLIQQAGVARQDAATGAITLIQRLWCYGSAANLNTHLHALVLDGVYSTAGAEDTPVFIETPPPTQPQLNTLLSKIIKRISKLLLKCGHLIEQGHT